MLNRKIQAGLCTALCCLVLGSCGKAGVSAAPATQATLTP